MLKRPIFITGLVVLAAVFGSCKETKRSSDNLGILYGPTKNDLMAHLTDLRTATRLGETKKASVLSVLFLPDDDDIKLALRKNTKRSFKKIAELHRKFIPKDDAAAANIFGRRPEQSEIQIHAATTEELIRYRKDSPAVREFPESVQKIARQILRPKTTFYEVEFLEPGHSKGMKYHLFFYNGKNWKMLGPVWRVIL